MKNRRFEEFFRQYKNLIIKLVMSKIGDYQVAQELCQQVYVSFYNHMDSISDELVKAWLLRATQNEIVDYLRKNKGHVDVVLDESVVAEYGNLLMEKSVELFEEKENKRELLGRIMQEVKATNEQWYDVLFKSCVEELSYADIAKEMGISETVLRARMHRARVFIKQRFGDEYLDR
jgi:RNA polymerase sigma-70 factor (ECF subfamily)